MRIKPDVLYEILQKQFGNLRWWPVDRKYHRENNSDPRFEIIVGAILTQNTAWSNVEKALTNLKLKNSLNLESICAIETKELEKMIKPSGFFKQKAKRLKTISNYFKNNYSNNLDRFFNRSLLEIRQELLSLNGIGPETADSILLYAGNKPIFVVDAYTKRICQRIPLDTGNLYDEIQKYFQKNISNNFTKEELSKVYGDLHALIVILAKEHCRKKPNCFDCPLKEYCSFSKLLS